MFEEERLLWRKKLYFLVKLTPVIFILITASKMYLKSFCRTTGSLESRYPYRQKRAAHLCSAISVHVFIYCNTSFTFSLSWKCENSCKVVKGMLCYFYTVCAHSHLYSSSTCSTQPLLHWIWPQRRYRRLPRSAHTPEQNLHVCTKLNISL